MTQRSLVRTVTLLLVLTGLCVSPTEALYYDFEQGDQGWEQINGTCGEEGGVYVVTGSDGVGVLPDADWQEGWSDYTVECQAMMEQGPDNMGLLVRYQDAGTYYIFAVMNGRQQAEVWSRIAGTYTEEGVFPFENELGEWYTMRIEAVGSAFAFYVNDELITEWEDDRLETGKVGVRTYASVSHFDNVLITGPGIPHSPGEPGASVDPQAKIAVVWGEIKW